MTIESCERLPIGTNGFSPSLGTFVGGMWSHRNEGALSKANELAVKYGTDTVSSTIRYEPVAIARMIAKIAYGFTVVAVGCDLTQIAEAFVLPAILGQTNDVGMWVGCLDEKNLAKGDNFHEVKLSVENGEVHASVRLFAELTAPEYRVVVGRIRKNSLAAVISDYQPKGMNIIG